MTDFFAADHGLPCRNPYCKSHGLPHPNCRCYQGSSVGLAKGGKVEAFCGQNRSHNPSCTLFADGGPVPYALYADGGDVEDQHMDPKADVDHYVAGRGLLSLLTRAGQSKSPDMNKPVQEYLAGVGRGRDRIGAHVSHLFEDTPIDSHDPKQLTRLDEHLESLKADPSPLLSVGGHVSQFLPDHAVQAATTAAQAVQYLQAHKPQPIQVSPLDAPVQAGAVADSQYRRQLAAAEHPLSIVKKAKNGTLLPSDVATVRSLYPTLFKSLTDATMAGLVKHQTSKKPLSRKQRAGLSTLLGQPLDTTQTGEAARAIVQSQASQQARRMPNPPREGAKKASVSAPELKAIEKADSLAETSIEANLTRKKAQ